MDKDSDSASNVVFEEFLDKQIHLLFEGVRARSGLKVKAHLNTFVRSPAYDEAGYFVEKVFLRNSQISDEEVDLLLNLADIQDIHNVLITLSVNFERNYFNPVRFEKFFFSVGEYTDENHHKGGEYERLAYVSDKHLSSIVRLIACTCLKADAGVVVEAGLKLIRQMRIKSDLSNLDCILLESLMKAGSGMGVDPKGYLNAKARDFEVVSAIVCELSLDVADEALGKLIPMAITLADRADTGMYSNASAEALRTNKDMLLTKLSEVLADKPIEAMRIFGDRRKPHQGSIIFRSMANLALSVSRSGLDETLKTTLCTRLVQVAAEGKTKTMDALMIFEVIQNAGSFVDYPSLVKNITSRGATNLIESGADTRQFAHLLKPSHRGLAFEKGLGL